MVSRRQLGGWISVRSEMPLFRYGPRGLWFESLVFGILSISNTQALIGPDRLAMRCLEGTLDESRFANTMSDCFA